MEMIPGLTCLMESLDKLNRAAPGYEKEEHDDMTWTGIHIHTWNKPGHLPINGQSHDSLKQS